MAKPLIDGRLNELERFIVSVPPEVFARPFMITAVDAAASCMYNFETIPHSPAPDGYHDTSVSLSVPPMLAQVAAEDAAEF